MEHNWYKHHHKPQLWEEFNTFHNKGVAGILFVYKYKCTLYFMCCKEDMSPFVFVPEHILEH